MVQLSMKVHDYETSNWMIQMTIKKPQDSLEKELKIFNEYCDYICMSSSLNAWESLEKTVTIFSEKIKSGWLSNIKVSKDSKEPEK